jgi:cell filamentation protein
MNDKYGVYQDAYCYPNTDVLINLLDIREHAALEAAEVEFTKFRLLQLEHPVFTDLSLSTLKNIHFYLFQDIYDWAGEIRSVDIAKDRTRFATCSRVELEAQKLFQLLREEDFLRGLQRSDFVERLAFYFSELNVIHPFREGNGRAQRVLFEFLAINAGFALRWQPIDPLRWIPANIAAFNCQLGPLISLLDNAVTKIELPLH